MLGSRDQRGIPGKRGGRWGGRGWGCRGRWGTWYLQLEPFLALGPLDHSRVWRRGRGRRPSRGGNLGTSPRGSLCILGTSPREHCLPGRARLSNRDWGTLSYRASLGIMGSRDSLGTLGLLGTLRVWVCNMGSWDTLGILLGTRGGR